MIKIAANFVFPQLVTMFVPAHKNQALSGFVMSYVMPQSLSSPGSVALATICNMQGFSSENLLCTIQPHLTAALLLLGVYTSIEVKHVLPPLCWGQR